LKNISSFIETIFNYLVFFNNKISENMKTLNFFKTIILLSFFILIKTVGNSQITINEVICKDEVSPYFTDEEGDGTDWVEIYNAGSTAINIALMRITDDPSDAFSSCEEIPDTDASATTIEAGGFLILICGAADASGNDIPTSITDGIIYIDMGIKASNDDNIVLYDSDESELDRTGDIPNDLEDESSYGKTTDGGSTFQAFSTPTPNASNEVESINDIEYNFFSINPNPNTGIFSITKKNNNPSNIRISDITGKQVYNSVFSAKKQSININLSKGIFFIQIKDKITKQIFIKRLIIK